VVSPFARKGFVDHTPYDTTSILRLIARRFQLPVLPGIRHRDDAVKSHGEPPLGDLTNALTLSGH
jgi:phospholipase C